MDCPRDHVELVSQGYWEQPRHNCPTCAGMLFSESAIMSALGHPPHKTFGTQAGIEVAKLPPIGLLCPRDSQPMHALVFTDIELDICPGCRSVWLDHGEFEKIRALRKGGVGDAIVDGAVQEGTGQVLDFLGDALGSLFDGIGF